MRRVDRISLGIDRLHLHPRLPVHDRVAHRGLQKAEELLAARREHQLWRLRAEIRPHDAFAQRRLQQDGERLLDIVIAADVAEAAGRVGPYREPPAGAKEAWLVRGHGSASTICFMVSTTLRSVPSASFSGCNSCGEPMSGSVMAGTPAMLMNAPARLSSTLIGSIPCMIPLAEVRAFSCAHCRVESSSAFPAASACLMDYSSSSIRFITLCSCWMMQPSMAMSSARMSLTNGTIASGVGTSRQ